MFAENDEKYKDNSRYRKTNYSSANTVVIHKPLNELNKFKNMIDEKFGLLTVEKYLGLNKYGNVVWGCKCECGNFARVASTNLIYRNKKSCGCLVNEYEEEIRRQEFTKKEEVVYSTALNGVYKSYQYSAKKRNHNFNLNLKQFYDLILQNCYYCGIPPNIWRIFNETHFIISNGIDRVNNKKGYEIGNVVACCQNCNRSKKDLSIEDFKIYVTRLIDNSKNWLSND